MSSVAIGIMSKAPRPGVSKTRLRSVLGPEAAAELSACFLRDVASAIALVPAAVSWKGYAVYAPEGFEEALRALLPDDFSLLSQSNADFGLVLFRAAETLLAAGHEAVILVNADSPTLPPLLIASAIAALRGGEDRLVLGPAIDGGYTLIGLRQPHRRLFEDISWSTSLVAEQTLQRAAEIALPVRLLPEWYDVDDAATLAILLDELAGGTPPFATPGLTGAPAEATREFLSRNNFLLPRGRPATAAGEAIAVEP